MLQTGDHHTVSDLNLEGHRFGWALDEAKELGPFRFGHVQDARARMPEPGKVDEEAPSTSFEASLKPERPSRS
jgi:hypothetical protein